MNTKTKYKILIALLIIVIILNWTTISELVKNSNHSTTGDAVDKLPTIYNETTVAPEVYFCPQDECLDEMLMWLDAAEEYIHCAIFEVELVELQEKLFQRSEEIEVKLITDDRYFDEVKHLDFAMHDNRSGLMHNKFCVLDGKAVWTGSFNPTERGNYRNNNNVVFYQSQYLADNYEKEFQEMWKGSFGKGDRNDKTEFIINGKRIENYFCPEDWCANKVMYALQDAEKSIYFMTFSFTHDDIGEQVLEMASDGVEVRGVFEKSQNNKYTEFNRFADAGLDVRWDGNPANMHHKVFIIDSKTVVTGSFNPTNNADTRNDENLLIIHDAVVAAKYLEEFEKVWTAAGE